jgi:hypothetical protein
MTRSSVGDYGLDYRPMIVPVPYIQIKEFLHIVKGPRPRMCLRHF